MKTSIKENEKIVKEVCDMVKRATETNKKIQSYQQIIYDIDYLLMEVNSGASFEQYFRWASVKEIRRVEKALNVVGLKDISELTQQALAVAFPNGIPNDEEAKENLTDWSEEQEEKLEILFEIFKNSNVRIINTLANYAKSVKV